jgi:nucleoside-diphosphate-sugar epimerase
MRVFLTGTTGYIGFNVALGFRRHGHEVWGLVRQPEKVNYLVRHEIHTVLGDMARPETYARVAAEADVFVHAAYDGWAGIVGPDRTTVETLLEVAGKGPQAKTLLYTSGVWVYGDTGDRIADEASPLKPARAAVWRVAHEELVLNAARVRGVVIRPGCVYGKQGGLTGGWFAGALGRRPFEVVGSGGNRWAMVHVWDVADAYVRAAEKGDLGGEAVNLVDPSHTTIREMATAAADAAGYTGEIRYVPVADAEQTMGPLAEALALDQRVTSRKAGWKLGWKPRFHGFVADVATYLEAWKAYNS